jgi:hypothetical protein
MLKLLLVLGISVVAAAITAVMYSLIWTLGSMPKSSTATLQFFSWALFGTTITGIIWFYTRKNQSFQYIESVLWGIMSFFLSFCFTLFVFRFSKSNPFDFFKGIYISISLIFLPLNILFISPLVVYAWKKAIDVQLR